MEFQEVVENRKLRRIDFGFSLIGILIVFFGIDFVIELIKNEPQQII